jgi:hypothetical protein
LPAPAAVLPGGGWTLARGGRQSCPQAQRLAGHANRDLVDTAQVSQPSPSLPFSGYALRRVVVAPDLDALRGPLSGRRQLPWHLDSSARPFYDFASPRDRATAYQLVLLEAGAADLEQWLQRDELLRLWPQLYLPRNVRGAWQSHHALLARIGAGPHVPQL